MPTTWMDTVVRQVRRVGDFPFPRQAALVLDNPIHRKFVNPAGVAEQLALHGGEHVLEIGPVLESSACTSRHDSLPVDSSCSTCSPKCLKW